MGKHHAWCSPVFDARSLSRYAAGARQPPSSDPLTIYRELHQATIERPDEHNSKIASQRSVLNGLAIDWHASGQITEAQRDEIVANLKYSPITDWRPLLLIIPFAPVETRVKDVPRPDRASLEPEFIVPDLVAEEFDIIELHL